MTSQNSFHRSGIAVAGNLLCDRVKQIAQYPPKGMLTDILSLTTAVGGCVPNTAIDLSRIDPALPVFAYGRVGADEDGSFLLRELKKHGIDVRGVTVSQTAQTSFTDVMSEGNAGERTFFHHRGANAEFSPEHLPIETLTCKMLHIGYLLLLDRFDAPHPTEGTVMANLLKEAQKAGIHTSVDAVSDSGGRFAETILPALRYTDTVVLNEIEACGISGAPARDRDGTLLRGNIRRAMERMMACGVRQRVIVHSPEAGWILNRETGFTERASLSLPKGFIKGAVGAGDAFCAGCLYGIYHGYSDADILQFAAGAAVCCLSAGDAVSGMRTKAQIEEQIRAFS